MMWYETAIDGGIFSRPFPNPFLLLCFSDFFFKFACRNTAFFKSVSPPKSEKKKIQKLLGICPVTRKQKTESEKKGEL